MLHHSQFYSSIFTVFFCKHYNLQDVTKFTSVFIKKIFTFKALLALPSEVIVWIYVSLKPVNVK